jgi:hypothetical protein
MVRWGVRRSVLFRKLAIRLDDFFYGKLPPPLEVPDWMTAAPRGHAAGSDTRNGLGEPK